MDTPDQVTLPKTTCSVCNNIAVRIQTGISPNKRRKYYSDEHGRAWRGRKCPVCACRDHTEYMRQRRKAKDEI